MGIGGANLSALFQCFVATLLQYLLMPLTAVAK